MVPRITTILQRFTTEWTTLLPPGAMLAVCGEIGYTEWRRRVLTPVTTMQLFLLQMLHGNTACSHLPHLSGVRFSAAAYGQARTKLPRHCFALLFALLLEGFGRAVQSSALDEGRWHGHRTCFVDGSGCSMSDTPALQDALGQSTEQRPGCGVPVAHLMVLFHAGTSVLLQLVVAPLMTHDLAQVQKVHLCSHPVMCSWRIRGCVRTPISPCSSGPVCTPCSASARDRSWISQPVGLLSSRVCGEHLPSKASHGPAGSQLWVSTTNSWRG
jgi:hypothetical protein